MNIDGPALEEDAATRESLPRLGRGGSVILVVKDHRHEVSFSGEPGQVKRAAHRNSPGGARRVSPRCRTDPVPTWCQTCPVHRALSARAVTREGRLFGRLGSHGHAEFALERDSYSVGRGSDSRPRLHSFRDVRISPRGLSREGRPSRDVVRLACFLGRRCARSGPCSRRRRIGPSTNRPTWSAPWTACPRRRRSSPLWLPWSSQVARSTLASCGL